MKSRKYLYVGVLVILAVLVGYASRDATACVPTQRLYDYWDASRTNLVGQGETSCATGTFHMAWGQKTAYYTMTTETCSCGCWPDPNCH